VVVEELALAGEYTEETPKPIGRAVASRCLHHVRRHSSPFQGGSMWWIFGIALAIIVAAAYVLTRRPSRRATIVLERD
jgi:hypothetical protein